MCVLHGLQCPSLNPESILIATHTTCFEAKSCVFCSHNASLFCVTHTTDIHYFLYRINRSVFIIEGESLSCLRNYNSILRTFNSDTFFLYVIYSNNLITSFFEVTIRHEIQQAVDSKVSQPYRYFNNKFQIKINTRVHHNNACLNSHALLLRNTLIVDSNQ